MLDGRVLSIRRSSIRTCVVPNRSSLVHRHLAMYIDPVSWLYKIIYATPHTEKPLWFVQTPGVLGGGELFFSVLVCPFSVCLASFRSLFSRFTLLTLFLSSGLSFLRMSGLLPFPLFPFHPSKYKRLGEVGYGVHSPSWWLVTVVGMDPDWMFFDHEVDP
jgi:hypothetical protein